MAFLYLATHISNRPAMREQSGLSHFPPSPRMIALELSAIPSYQSNWRRIISWKFGDALNNLDEVINRAFSEGPQHIHHNGQVVVVLSEAEYQQLTGERKTLMEYILDGPDMSDLDLTRDPSPMRDVDL